MLIQSVNLIELGHRQRGGKGDGEGGGGGWGPAPLFAGHKAN